MATVDAPRLRFTTPAAWRAWVDEHQDDDAGVWLVFAKKGAVKKDPSVLTITYAEALEVALQYGWIDGQARGLDETYYLQRFTPRRSRSMWSVRNRTAVEAMIGAGTMTPRGLAEVERARADGRWDAAYAGPKVAQPHPDFLAALAANPEAAAFYATLSSQNRYALYFRIQNAKREATRARRIKQFVAMLARGETLY
ncbi:bacteriocin-protection protein [Tersicoccus phoenicis]|uniref:Bacteriocin-protection protein n=1 Tax=Tersicoccus phoenicis TaxID=554083 RepID=A0A1R1LPT7_9MICC|nr:YdeI/OmpD-associated family protein [Tersicoccus phoenicis]OMH29534.1 bacteriocin-protection protein [Tersicoccus phoenicis]